MHTLTGQGKSRKEIPNALDFEEADYVTDQISLYVVGSLLYFSRYLSLYDIYLLLTRYYIDSIISVWDRFQKLKHSEI